MKEINFYTLSKRGKKILPAFEMNGTLTMGTSLEGLAFPADLSMLRICNGKDSPSDSQLSLHFGTCSSETPCHFKFLYLVIHSSIYSFCSVLVNLQ